MKTSSARFAFVAAAMAGAVALAFVPVLQAASPADGQPAAAGTMDHSGMTGAMPMDHGNMATMDHAKPSAEQMRGMMQQHQEMMARMHGQQAQSGVPTMPGQDAFGAIQEIVRMLESDPMTDWSKVDLEALRQHLIDMNDVTLQADVATRPVEGGLEMAVTGSGRTLAAVQRMVPAHAAKIDGRHGWSAKTAPLGNGILLTVTASDAKEVQHIRGLGFIGILVSGSHHQPHHLAMAKGEFEHSGLPASTEHAQHMH